MIWCKSLLSMFYNVVSFTVMLIVLIKRYLLVCVVYMFFVKLYVAEGRKVE